MNDRDKLEQCQDSYGRLLITHQDLKDKYDRLRPSPTRAAKKTVKKTVQKTGVKHPRFKGSKAAGIAAGIWMVLHKTEWLSRFVEPGLILPKGFFQDADVAGYCAIGLTWLVRELYQSFGRTVD